MKPQYWILIAVLVFVLGYIFIGLPSSKPSAPEGEPTDLIMVGWKEGKLLGVDETSVIVSVPYIAGQDGTVHFQANPKAFSKMIVGYYKVVNRTKQSLVVSIAGQNLDGVVVKPGQTRENKKGNLAVFPVQTMVYTNVSGDPNVDVVVGVKFVP